MDFLLHGNGERSNSKDLYVFKDAEKGHIAQWKPLVR